MPSPDVSGCEALVRRVDPDRWLAALFAPAPVRRHLFALYAFNYEIARIADSVSQPVMGQIRLQWWREAIGEIYGGRTPRRHDVVLALAETVRAHDLPRDLFDALIDAREHDLDEAPFADWPNLEAYAAATSGTIMRLAARILGGGPAVDAAARDAGIAYALTGLSRAFGFHAAHRRLMLPAQSLRELGLSQERIFSGVYDTKLASLSAQTMERARGHLRRARETRIPRSVLPAFLPAALVPRYAKILTSTGFNPFRDVTDIPVHRRQLAMLGAIARGRL
jgi:phytoene/squalene synthetase